MKGPRWMAWCKDSPTLCSVKGCLRHIHARGFCQTHYWRWQQYGKIGVVDLPTKSPQNRFWPKVERTETCWLWRGANNNLSYGCLFVNMGTVLSKLGGTWLP